MNKGLAATIDDQLAKYLLETFHPQEPALTEIRERAQQAGLPPIHVGPMDGLHLEVLARAAGIRKAVEIGTLAGLSGTCIARGLLPGGKLYTFEYEPRHAEVARETFRKAGVSDQVEIFVGAALVNLPKITAFGPFDLVFIDADKENYPNYLAWAMENVRKGGLIIGDNTLGWGKITDQRFEDAQEERSIRGLQKFNQMLASHPGFRTTLIPTGEGLTVAVKI